MSIRRLFTIGCAVVACGLVGATAYAAIPSADSGVFYGCVAKRTGYLRVVDPSAGGRCRTTRGFEETPIQWNQTGPAGPATPAGLTYTRTATATISDSVAFAQLDATCDPGDVPIHGYWNFNGELGTDATGTVSQAVSFDHQDTGMTPTGYRLVVSRSSADQRTPGATPVAAIVVCLNTA